MENRKYCDRAEENKKAVAKRRKKIKSMAIEYKGGQCCVCGYSKCSAALDFHHKLGEEKLFGLGLNGMTRSWERTKAEVDKCVLVCANCHREIHEGMTQIL